MLKGLHCTVKTAGKYEDGVIVSDALVVPKGEYSDIQYSVLVKGKIVVSDYFDLSDIKIGVSV